MIISLPLNSQHVSESGIFYTKVTDQYSNSAGVNDSSFAKIFTYLAHFTIVPQILYVLNSFVLLYAHTLAKHPHPQLIPRRRLHIVSRAS